MPPPPTPPVSLCSPVCPTSGYDVVMVSVLFLGVLSQLLISMRIPSLPFVGRPFVFLAVLILTGRLSDWCRFMSQL